MATKLHAITKAFNQASVQCHKHDATLKAAVDKHIADNKAAQDALWKAWQAALLAAVQGDNIPLLQISESLYNLSDERIKALTNAKGEQGALKDLFIQNNNKVWVVKKKTQLDKNAQISLVADLFNPFEVEKAKPAAKTPLQQAQAKVTAAFKIATQCRDFCDLKDLMALTAILSRMQTALAKAQELDATAGEDLPSVASQAAVSKTKAQAKPKAQAQAQAKPASMPKAAQAKPKAAVSTLPKAQAQAAVSTLPKAQAQAAVSTLPKAQAQAAVSTLPKAQAQAAAMQH